MVGADYRTGADEPDNLAAGQRAVPVASSQVRLSHWQYSGSLC